MYKTIKMKLKKDNPMYETIDDLSWKAKNLYNFGLYYIRQSYFIDRKIYKQKDLTEDDMLFLEKLKDLYVKNGIEFKEYDKNNVEYKYEKFVAKNLNKLLKQEDSKKSLNSSALERFILSEVEKNWKSFDESSKKYFKNPSGYTGMPKMPNYKGKDKGNNVDDKERFRLRTNYQCFKIDENQDVIFTLGGLKPFTAKFDKKEPIKPLCKFNLSFLKIENIDVKTIDFIKNKHEDHYDIFITYDDGIEFPDFKKDKVIFNDNMDRVISIDFGVDKFATIVNNFNEKPISIKSGELLSKLHFYQNKLDFYKSENKKCNDKNWSKNQSKYQVKLNNYKNTWVHNKTAFVINYCKENNVDTIIIGKNKQWKTEVDLGAKNNFNFVNLPHTIFLDKLVYKCQLNGINLIITEESYTSGCSFIDGEKPNKENYNKTRRIKRGLFQSNGGIYIHSDVNGAYNIMNKVVDYSWNGNKKILHPSIV